MSRFGGALVRLSRNGGERSRSRHCGPVIFRGHIAPGENSGREKRERKFSQHHWACSGAEVGACSCWPVTTSSCLNSFFTATKNKGTKKIARTEIGRASRRARVCQYV